MICPRCGEEMVDGICENCGFPVNMKVKKITAFVRRRAVKRTH